MGTSSSNMRVFNRGMKKAMQVISGAFDEKFESLARKLFKALCNSKFYQGYTGNTQRSYTVALFLDGELRLMLQGKDEWNYHEIRLKVKYKERSYLRRPYEGGKRGVVGSAEVDDYYGWQTALTYVMNHVEIHKGWQIICGVGTEYYFDLAKNPWDNMEDQIIYYLEQDKLIDKMLKQVNGLVEMRLH